ncbi:MAG: hypothetical protein KBD63_03485 [Bacteriovoracaceae bacterium]|nr:hypothetical protein [Bacteriovoracaceae bacterium]
MRKFLKIMLVLFLVFILFLGGALYYVSTKITPAEVKKLITEQATQVFPNAKVELKELDYRLGFSITFFIKNFSLVLKEGLWEGEGQKLLSVESLEIKVPLWAILTEGGTVQIFTEKPLATYAIKQQKNNWQVAMGSKENSEAVVTVENSQKKSSMPDFVLRSRVNLFIKEMQVSYIPEASEKMQLDVESFEIKNIGLNDKSNYALNMKLDLKQNKKTTVKFNTSLTGTLENAPLFERQDVITQFELVLKNIQAQALKTNIDELTTQADLKVIKGNSSGDFKVSSPNLLKSSFHLEQTLEKLEISQMDLSLKIVSLINLMGLQDKISQVELGQAEFKATGVVTKSATKIIPDLDFEVTEAITIKIPEAEIKSNISGHLKKEKLFLRLDNSLLGGKALADVKTDLDLSQEFSMEKLPLTHVKLLLSDFTITRKTIQQMLYAKKAPETKNQVVSGKNTADPSAESNYPKIALDLKVRGVKVDTSLMTMDGLIDIKDKTIKSQNLGFTFAKGTGRMPFEMTTLSPTASKIKLDFKMNNLNLDALHAFLPPMMESIHGDFSGSVVGVVQTSLKGASYDLDVNLNAKQGLIKGLNLTDKIREVIMGLPFLKNSSAAKKEYKVTDGFEEMVVVGKVTDKEMNFKNVKLMGVHEKEYDLFGSGVIYPLGDKEGTMMMTLVDHEGSIRDPLKKYAGMEELPLKLKGKGYVLKPDMGYTLGIVSKKALKAQTNQQLDKLKEKLKTPETQQKIKDQVQKVFKGLFK